MIDEPIGVIFDWDGVIIDSHNQHEQSWQKLAEENNKTLPINFFKETFGMRNESIIPNHFGDWIDNSKKIKFKISPIERNKSTEKSLSNLESIHSQELKPY